MFKDGNFYYNLNLISVFTILTSCDLVNWIAQRIEKLARTTDLSASVNPSSRWTQNTDLYFTRMLSKKVKFFRKKKRKEERTGCDIRFSSERLNLVKRFSFKNYVLWCKQTKAMRDFRCWLPVEAFSFKCNSRSSSLNRSELWAAASNCSIRGEFARPSESIFAILVS